MGLEGKKIIIRTSEVVDGGVKKNDKLLSKQSIFRPRFKTGIFCFVRHYNYIFDITTLMFSSPTDDLTVQVKAELGIK